MTSVFVNHNFEAVEEVVSEKCAVCPRSCSDVLKPREGLLARQEVRVGYNMARAGGPLCSLCTGQPFRSINSKLSRKQTGINGDWVYAVRPGTLSDKLHVLLRELVGPSKDELAGGGLEYYEQRKGSLEYLILPPNIFGGNIIYLQESDDDSDDDSGDDDFLVQVPQQPQVQFSPEVITLEVDDLEDPGRREEDCIQDFFDDDDDDVFMEMVEQHEAKEKSSDVTCDFDEADDKILLAM